MPSGGAVSVPAFSATLGSITITTTNFSDAGSGIASNVITRSNAQAPSSPGVCPAGGYTGATVVTSPDTVPTDGQCYLYTLTGTDNVGNTATDQPPARSWSTPPPPSTPTVTFSGLSAGNTYDNGSGTLFFRPSAGGTFTVNAASTDAQSGIQAGNAGYSFGTPQQQRRQQLRHRARPPARSRSPSPAQPPARPPAHRHQHQRLRPELRHRQLHHHPGLDRAQRRRRSRCPPSRPRSARSRSPPPTTPTPAPGSPPT